MISPAGRRDPAGRSTVTTKDETNLDLAQVLAEVARSLLAETSLKATLNRICELAVATIDGCDHAGVSLVEGRTISTQGSSDDVATRVDAIQYETGEGPCLDAIRDHEVVVTDDLATEERWPDFASRTVVDVGARSMLSFRLFADEDTLGALNLYSREPGAFGDESREFGCLFAAHAAVAMSSAKQHEQMEEALRSRDVIGQAKGILMARQGVTEDQAFDMLRRASQRLNVKLREVAERVAGSRSAKLADQ
jgi:transcriptional regulator with GAF, ATPase, and Fis domain